MKPTSDILRRIQCNSRLHHYGIYTRLYRYLLREDIYLLAYKKLYKNKGAGTKGIDDDTADGFGAEYVSSIIDELRDLTYKPKPQKRVYIPKRNGKLRPLDIPSFRDKLVQEAIRLILEAIYEPIFSDFSHGFRPNRSCHTALKQMCSSFKGAIWFIEGDITKCFKNIDHNLLLDLLAKKIKDSKFLNLIRKFLKAGFMDDWQYNRTYSGTPQGGVLSPILANIYLHKLDEKIADMQRNFDAPAKHTRNPAYVAQEKAIQTLRKRYMRSKDYVARKVLLKQIHKARTDLCKIPCSDRTDKKIVYVRYADDFLIGVKGNRSDAERIKCELTEFTSASLKLELNGDKTKITHSSQRIRFLGYDVKVRRNQKAKRTSNGLVKRTLNLSVELLVPTTVIEKFLYDHDIVRQARDGSLFPKRRECILSNTDLEILDTYNAQTRGICNYYSLACNFSNLSYFTYLMEYSCLKTLAMKHKTHISAIYDKYRIGKTWGISYKTKSGQQTMKIVKLSNLKRQEVFGTRIKTHNVEDVDVIRHSIHGYERNSLEARFSARRCELCGIEGEGITFEIHHVNKVKDLKGKKAWERTMIAKKRKTLVVCRECHKRIHNYS